MTKITELRKEVDEIDKQLVELLSRRAQVSLQIRIAKGSSNVYRPEREAEVVRNVVAVNQGPLSAEAIATLFHTIIYVCRSIQEANLPDASTPAPEPGDEE